VCTKYGYDFDTEPVVYSYSESVVPEASEEEPPEDDEDEGGDGEEEEDDEDEEELAETTTDSDGYYTNVAASQASLTPAGVESIIASLGVDPAEPAPLTITLIWNAAADLDLLFLCDDGSQIDYLSAEATGGCQGRFDKEA